MFYNIIVTKSPLGLAVMIIAGAPYMDDILFSMAVDITKKGHYQVLHMVSRNTPQQKRIHNKGPKFTWIPGN